MRQGVRESLRVLKKNRSMSVLAVLLLCIGLFFITNKAIAMPVEDFGEWARTAQVSSEQAQQLSQLYKQYQELQQQYHQMQQQYSAVTGSYGWGGFNNSQSQLTQDHQWAPSDWKSALQGMSGGNPARYQQLLAQYKQAHPSMSQSSFAKGSDTNLAQSYNNQVQNNQASSTQATYEFNNINKHMQNLYSLSQQIDQANKNGDLKSAVDLNSRIQIEMGYINVEELRMQTLLNQQFSQSSATRISDENEASQFNQAGVQP